MNYFYFVSYIGHPRDAPPEADAFGRAEVCTSVPITHFDELQVIEEQIAQIEHCDSVVALTYQLLRIEP